MRNKCHSLGASYVKTNMCIRFSCVQYSRVYLLASRGFFTHEKVIDFLTLMFFCWLALNVGGNQATNAEQVEDARVVEGDECKHI